MIKKLPLIKKETYTQLRLRFFYKELTAGHYRQHNNKKNQDVLFLDILMKINRLGFFA